jgi:protein-S-isoprenylcysteine O-methyltransferase Ste14
VPGAEGLASNGVLVVVFASTLAAELVLGAILLLSILRPAARIWPPPGRGSWQYRTVWGLVDLVTVGIVCVGILDWNRFALDTWLRVPFGAVLAAAGGAFALWGIHTLSWHASLGLEAELVRTGPYRWTRNPQYVGDIAMLAGWAIVSGSLLGGVLCLLAMAWFAAAPLAEEPWLREHYGPAYDDYRRRVPRFLGLPRRR